MKTLIGMILSFFFFSAFLFAQDTLTILHLNDTHSMLAPIGPRTEDLKGTQGGISRAASVIGQSKITETNVLTLHGGDIFIGDLFFNQYFGIAEMKMMNALGFDAFAVGNHEFDLGPAILKMAFDSSLARGGFEVLSSNIILEDPEVQELKNYIKPYTIKEFGNLKAGIFSLTTPSTNYFSMPSPVVIDTNIEACITNAMTALLTEGCNIIICMSHLGIYYDQQIAASVPGINVIISAHDHLITETPLQIENPGGTTTYIVQAGSFYSHVGKMKLIFNSEQISNVEYELITLDETIPEEPTIAAQVDLLVADIEAAFEIPFYTQQIGYAADFFDEVADSLFIEGNHSTAVGNLVADALKWKTGSDIAITLGGLTAQPLYPGPLVAADIYRMISYGFNEINTLGYRVTKFNITAPVLWYALQACLSQTIIDDELLPQGSGLEYGYAYSDTGCQLLWAKVNGVSVSLTSTEQYSVTANEFVLYALQNVFGLPVLDDTTLTDVTEFQAVLEYIVNKGGIITPNKDSRVTPVENTKQKNSIPVEFRLNQNYPNPFNPNTIIEFSIPVQQLVTLKIFDITGKEVDTLVNEVLSAGVHKYNWKPKNLSSGVYYYRLAAGDFSQTRKLVLMK